MYSTRLLAAPSLCKAEQLSGVSELSFRLVTRRLRYDASDCAFPSLCATHHNHVFCPCLFRSYLKSCAYKIIVFMCAFLSCCHGIRSDPLGSKTKTRYVCISIALEIRQDVSGPDVRAQDRVGATVVREPRAERGRRRCSYSSACERAYRAVRACRGSVSWYNSVPCSVRVGGG